MVHADQHERRQFAIVGRSSGSAYVTFTDRNIGTFSVKYCEGAPTCP
jgi:hypothetical protein